MSQQGGNGVTNDAQAVVSRQVADPLLGHVIDGRYQIESVLGEGGMGIVYRAIHTALNKPLAIKVLRPEVSKNDEIVARFKQEAQSASAIGNQHIIDISDFGVLTDGSTYFVMEFLEGCSLTAAMEESRLPTERTVHIGMQLCKALGAAHDRGIVHRDMKPDNVQLITRAGTDDFVKVLDFGIAKVGGSTTKLTQAGQVFGTPHYMSPEQCAGSGVDQRTDVYAVGVILYEMATGQVPFDADNLMGILTKHLYENPIPPHELPPPTDVPAALEAVILKCLTKKADQRYQGMDELLTDLEAVEAGATPRAVLEQVDRQSRSAEEHSLSLTEDEPGRMTLGVGQPAGVPRRSRVPLFFGGVLLLVGGVAGFLALPGSEPSGAADAHRVTPAPASQEGAEANAAPVTGEPVGEAAPAATGEAAAERPKTTLDSAPAGAEVYRDGDLVGSTPFALFRPEAGKKIRLVLRLDGYRDKSVLVRELSPEAMSVRLTKARKRAARPRKKPASGASKQPALAAPPSTAPKRGAQGGRLKSEVLDPWD